MFGEAAIPLYQLTVDLYVRVCAFLDPLKPTMKTVAHGKHRFRKEKRQGLRPDGDLVSIYT